MCIIFYNTIIIVIRFSIHTKKTKKKTKILKYYIYMNMYIYYIYNTMKTTFANVRFNKLVYQTFTEYILYIYIYVDYRV